jgi:hypothetical protein
LVRFASDWRGSWDVKRTDLLGIYPDVAEMATKKAGHKRQKQIWQEINGKKMGNRETRMTKRQRQRKKNLKLALVPVAAVECR